MNVPSKPSFTTSRVFKSKDEQLDTVTVSAETAPTEPDAEECAFRVTACDEGVFLSEAAALALAEFLTEEVASRRAERGKPTG